MNSLVILGLLALASASPDKAPRPSRLRGGRQDSYLAPELESQAAPSELDNSYLSPGASELDNSYLGPAASEPLSGYESLDSAASDLEGSELGLKMLMTSVPGVPGEDYPIYGEVPDTGFSCQGQIQGGYYADEDAECQVFHICGAEEAVYSFLCPNGTIFNQNYFTCDWWFNVDCSESAAIAAEKNAELAATREEAAASSAQASEAAGSYSGPQEAASYQVPEYEDEALTGYGDDVGTYTSGGF